MAGLDTAILFAWAAFDEMFDRQEKDGRVKPGHDG
jgi:hypothetical protein